MQPFVSRETHWLVCIGRAQRVPQQMLSRGGRQQTRQGCTWLKWRGVRVTASPIENGTRRVRVRKGVAVERRAQGDGTHGIDHSEVADVQMHVGFLCQLQLCSCNRKASCIRPPSTGAN